MRGCSCWQHGGVEYASEGVGVKQGDKRSEGAPQLGDRPLEVPANEAQLTAAAEQIAVLDIERDASDAAPEAGAGTPALAEPAAPAPANADATGMETADTPEPPQAPTAPGPQAAAKAATAERPEPLAAGARAGAFTIVRVLATTPEETRYLALDVDQGDQSVLDATVPGAYVTLIERAEGGPDGVAQQVVQGLRHPRLLSARGSFSANGRAYLAFDAIASPDGVLAPVVSDGAQLDPVAALTAGAGLADALAYLHRSNIAHLHISPEVLVIHNGRAYLDGLEAAEYVGALLDDAGALFARDANFLARSLGTLAGLPTEAPPDEPPAQAALRSIVAYGAAGSFPAPADLAGACTIALQAAGSAPSLLSVEHPQERLLLHVAAATSVGLVRSENQDAYATFVCDIRDDVTNEAPFAVFLVADGMGGEARGEVASRIAARMVLSELVGAFVVPALSRPAIMEMSEVPTTVLRAISRNDAEPSAASANGDNDTRAPEDELQRALKDAVAAANRQVRELASQLRQATGTTLTAFVTLGSRAALAHLGDSRAYLLRGDLLAQLTEDHSVLARLQAIDHPLLSDPDVFVPRNMLYRSLGQEDDPNPDLISLTLAVGDRILICSDGLWDEIEADALAQTLATAATPQLCAEQLVALANSTGGHDNSTAVVVFVHDVAQESATHEDNHPDELPTAPPGAPSEQPAE